MDTGTGPERFEVTGRTPELPQWIEEEPLPWAGTGKDAGEVAGADAAGDGDPSSRRTPWPPSRTIVCGQSLGGLAAELRQPQVAERLRRRRVRAHLSVGLGNRDMVPHSEAIAGALRAAGVSVTLEVSRHTHEMAGWMGVLSRGLLRLLG